MAMDYLPSVSSPALIEPDTINQERLGKLFGSLKAWTSTEDVNLIVEALKLVLNEVKQEQIASIIIESAENLQILTNLVHQFKNEDIRGLLLKIFQKLAVVPTISKIVEYENTSPIQSILTILQTSESLQQMSLKTLCFLSRNQSCSQSITTTGLSIIVGFLKKHPYTTSLLIQNLATDRNNAENLQKLGVTHQLIALLITSVESTDIEMEDARETITAALGNLTVYDQNRVIISDSGGLEVLVNMISGKNTNAVATLFNLSQNQNVRKTLYRTKNTLKKLTEILGSPVSDAMKVQATDILSLLAEDDDKRNMIAVFALDNVTKLLASHNTLLELAAVTCVSVLAKDRRTSNKMASTSGFLEAIVHLLESTNEKIQVAASRTLFTIAKFPENVGMIRSTNALLPLISVIQQTHFLNLKRNCVGVISIISEEGDGPEIVSKSGILPLVESLSLPFVIVNYTLQALLIFAGTSKAALSMAQCNIFEYCASLLVMGGTPKIDTNQIIRMKMNIILLLKALTQHEEVSVDLFSGRKYDKILGTLILSLLDLETLNASSEICLILLEIINKLMKPVIAKTQVAQNFELVQLLFDLCKSPRPDTSKAVKQLLTDMGVLALLENSFKKTDITDDDEESWISSDYFTKVFSPKKPIMSSESPLANIQKVSWDFFIDEKSQGVVPENSLYVPGNYHTLRIDNGTDDPQHYQSKLTIIKDIYKLEFFPRRHYNFLSKDPTTNDVEIFSVLDSEVGEQYSGLKATKKNSERFTLPEDVCGLRSRRKHKIQALEEYFQSQEPGKTVYYVQDRNFCNDLLLLEEKHPQGVKTMKIAMIYCKGGQNSAKEWFSNVSPSAQFWSFVKVMGRYVQDIKELKGYKGDVGHGDAWHEVWKHGIEIVYHVAPQMNSEMHRRLIGNDIAVIFFQEIDSPFNPAIINDLGTVPQIFIVVQPYNNKYRLLYMHKTNIKDFGSSFPAGALFGPQEVKDRILTKLHDGFAMTKQCPPMSRLFYIPRANVTEELAKKYPPESRKDKMYEKANVRKRQRIMDFYREKGIYYDLFITVNECRGLTIKNAIPFVSVSLLGEKNKTKPLKSSNWDTTYKYSLVRVNELAELECVCYNSKMSSAEFLGECFIVISDILNIVKNADNTPHWFSMKTNTGTKGELSLSFSISKAGDIDTIDTDIDIAPEEISISEIARGQSKKIRRKSPRNERKKPPEN